VPVVIGDVTLDGDLTDWTQAQRIDSTLGVAGYELYGKVTADNYVIAIKAPTAIGANTTAWLNTDQDAATGYQIWDFAGGAEFNVNFNALGQAALFTDGAGQTLVNGDLIEFFSADNTIVEFAIPKELLGFAGEAAAIDTLFDINDTVFLPTDYSATQYTIETVSVDGSLSDWTQADRIDGVAPVAGYEVYGKVTGDSYVFAIQAPAGVSIGEFTTAWLNTDQNTATGHQIFGFTGGAEYNVDFDVNGVPFLYTGDAGEIPTQPIAALPFARSADGTVVEFAVTKEAIGNPEAIDTLFDINDTTFLPGNFGGPAYPLVDTSLLPQRIDFSTKVAIVYSETTAARFFGDPSLPGQLEINQTAYSQLFMAAQSQAATAGIPFDILTEADLLDLATLVNYDAIVFPSFQFVSTASLPDIENNLVLLAQYYDTSFIAAGNFMTSDENGNVLSGDPYARMKALFDLQAGGSGVDADVTITSAGAGFPGVGGYVAGEQIRTYEGASFLKFADATPTATPLTFIDNQTVTGTGAGDGTFAAVIASSINGDRNVHFSTEALLGDNNQLWQAIQYAVNDASTPTVGLQMGRQNAIVAMRNDMDQSQETFDVIDQTPSIYDVLLPILEQWKADYNVVGSYYINVGDNPPDQATDWAISGPYYQQLLAMGNEIGTHSYTHPEDTNPLSSTEIEFEFNQSQLLIEQQLGIDVVGAAIPGAPEQLPTSLEVLQYFDYLSGGFSSVGAGFPGAFGYILPTVQDTVYIAPNASFDFTLNGFLGMTPAEADAFWAAEWDSLTAHSDLPVIVWPIHDYGPTEWEIDPPDPTLYELSQFTNYIERAANFGSEFVTLADLAQRIESFEQASITSSVSGNVITATVNSSDAGKFALDLDNLDSDVIASVNGWYAYDNDSVFLDSDGGTFEITLGTVADDVTHITELPARSELLTLLGDDTNLNFSLIGEGEVVVDLKNVAGTSPNVAGAAITSQVGDILTLDLGAFGTHNVAIELVPDLII